MLLYFGNSLNSKVKNLSPEELRGWLRGDGDLQPLLLDVREPWELDICTLPGALAIPMQQIPERIGELDSTRATVCVCHHGVRSLQVAQYLELSGFSQLFNLEGGVDRWARCVDPEMATY